MMGRPIDPRSPAPFHQRGGWTGSSQSEVSIHISTTALRQKRPVANTCWKNSRLVTTALWLCRVISRGLIDLINRHLARDVAHLLTYVVAACSRRKCVQLRLDIDSGLTAEPGAAGLGVDIAMAGAAGRDVAH